MTKTAHTAWQSPDGRAHIEERNGLLWCYIGENHVGTQLHLEAAIKLVRCKLEDDHG